MVSLQPLPRFLVMLSPSLMVLPSAMLTCMVAALWSQVLLLLPLLLPPLSPLLPFPPLLLLISACLCRG